jgi:uncharacterized SAM-binding protein YcdF (DUF218 family)
MKSEYTLVIRPRRIATAISLITAAVLFAGVVLYGFRAPIVAWAGRQLVRVDAPAPSDVIVILAGGTPEREIEAADLYQAGFAPLIVMTQMPERTLGPALHARGITMQTTLDERLSYLRAMRVPDRAIIVLEPPIVSTIQEAERVSAWARPRGVSSLLVVTTAWHTARARYTFERALRGAGVAIRFRPASLAPYDPDRLLDDRIDLRESVFEWQKLILYRLTY